MAENVEIFHVNFKRLFEGGRSLAKGDSVDEGTFGVGRGNTPEEALAHANTMIAGMVENSGGKITLEQFTIASAVPVIERQRLSRYEALQQLCINFGSFRRSG